jgi:hypothetical protein
MLLSGIFSPQRLFASKVAHEFFKFFEKLRSQSCLTKHFNTVLTKLKIAIQKTLEGHTCLSQDDLQDLYQCIAIIVAHKDTNKESKIAILQVL